MKKWYTGVVHSHTTHSDGNLTPTQLVKKAEKIGLDFLIITDHNQFCDYIPKSDKVLVIPGTELTDDTWGHTNIWGVKEPIDNFKCESYAEWERKIAMAREKGAFICMNHPMCSNCGWHWPLEPEKVDCVEVWNSPQHTDNMIATAWWQDELRKGKKIPAVGGSDFHMDYVVTAHLDNPVTRVYAEECTQDAILNAIKAGHTTISPSVKGQTIYITSDDGIIGDTVKLTDTTKVTVSVDCLKKNQTLKIIDNSGLKYSYKATSTEPFAVTLPVESEGFISAQVEYDLHPLYSAVYGKVEQKILHSKNTGKLPPFIYSQTGAIYFEK
ncbi:MAG: CehA/McbA family metallohydrolase [Clostridia bacterium]|nr:CehA/McbA family metallohydrolase [Clostridia bacterium]